MSRHDDNETSRLEIARACWGAYELGRAPVAASVMAGHRSGRAADRVVRVLGMRHLAQAALTVRAAPVGHLLGGAVDVTHSASMVLLAVLSRKRRRGAIASAAIALAFGIAEAVVAVSRSGR